MNTALIIVLITGGIGAIAFLIGFLLRKLVPSYSKQQQEKINKKEVARHNVESIVIDPEKDIASITEQELIRKEKIKKIKREAKTEDEETQMMVEQNLADDEDLPLEK